MMDDPTAGLEGWIGRSEDAEGQVTAELAARFRATLAQMPLPEHGLPLGLHWCLALSPAEQGDLAHDGHPAKGHFLPAVPMPNRMWAAGALIFHDGLQIGDTVRRRSTIGDIRFKQGRTGPLCFVTVDHLFSTARGPAITERQDIVYRDAGSRGSAVAAADPAGTVAADRIVVRADSALLFRYSALTFNAHRIHYDRDYAVQDEGYPERVVHGPLQATLLMNYVAAQRGPPASFSFRAIRPAFANAPLCLAADPGSSFETVRTVDREGGSCMEAEARWPG